MPDDANRQELNERLNLIETMIAEGRRTTARRGSIFLLWGVAYYAAIAWSRWWNTTALPWAVVMIAAACLSAVLAMHARDCPRTTLGRALGCIWLAMGISAFVLFFSLGLSGRITDVRIFMAAAMAMLGMANGASALLLRWRMQLACAVVWWATAVVCCFAPLAAAVVVGLAAIFFCQIVFGVYAMISDSRNRLRGFNGAGGQEGPAHA